MFFNIPICLTILRFLFIAPLVFAILRGYWIFAALIFVIAVMTDFFDGRLARKLGQVTKLGACLDTLADKFFLAAIYLALFSESKGTLLPFWFVFLIISKESVQILGALYFALFKKRVKVSATLLGKFSMIPQVIVIIWAFSLSYFGKLPGAWFNIFLWIAAFFVIVPIFQYTFLVLKK